MSFFKNLFAPKTSELKKQIKELREITETFKELTLGKAKTLKELEEAQLKIHDTLHYFNHEEFYCKCGREHEQQIVDPLFVKKLDTAREIAGIPFVINSGYRCVKHNREVGGVEHSSHLRGLAADISTKTLRHRFLIVDALLKVGFSRIGVATDYIHADIDETKDDNIIWTYSKSASDLI